MEIPPSSSHATMEEAVSAMHKAVGPSVTMKPAPSGSSEGSATRNKKRGAKRNESFAFIDPEKVPIWLRRFSCSHHPRRRAVPEHERIRSGGSMDKECPFMATIVCKPSRESVEDEPTYSFHLRFYVKKSTVEMFADGHSHNVATTANVQFVNSRNCRLTLSEKQKIAELSALKVPVRDIIAQIGGLVSEDGRIRRPRDVSNFISSLRRTAEGAQGPEATCLDKLLDYLLKLRAAFEIYVITSAGSRVSFRESAFICNDQGIPLREFLKGSTFTDLHVLLPGTETIAKAYGSCVCIDATHDSNRNRLTLYSSVVGDSSNHGHLITTSLLVREDSVSVGNALRFQKEVAGLSHETVIIDKSHVEMAALRSSLPLSKVIYCAFHMIKVFPEQVIPKYVPFEYRDTVAGIWRRMVLAESMHVFEHQWQTMKALCKTFPDINRDRYPVAPANLELYIEKNWLNCKELWVRQYQLKTSSRGTFTNNLIESMHNTLKMDAGLTTSLQELYRILVQMSLRTRSDAKNDAARKILRGEDPLSPSGHSVLPLARTWSGWLGDSVARHMDASIEHVRPTRRNGGRFASYFDTSSSVKRIGDVTEIEMHFCGFTASSKPVKTTIYTTEMPGTRTTATPGTWDASLFVRGTCTVDCDQFRNWGCATPCRHVVRSAFYVASGSQEIALSLRADVNAVKVVRAPVPASFFPSRDLTRTALEVYATSFEELNKAVGDAEKSTNERFVVLGVQKLPRAPASDPIDALVLRYMPDLKYCAELMASLSAHSVGARADAKNVAMFLGELGTELQERRRKIGVVRIVSIWRRSVVLGQETIEAEPLPEEGPEAYYIRHLQSCRSYARVLASLADPRRPCTTTSGSSGSSKSSLSATAAGGDVASWALCLVGTLLDVIRKAQSEYIYKKMEDKTVKEVATKVSQLFCLPTVERRETSRLRRPLADMSNQTPLATEASGILPVPVPMGRAAARQANVRKRRRTEVLSSQVAVSQNDSVQLEALIDAAALHATRQTAFTGSR